MSRVAFLPRGEQKPGEETIEREPLGESQVKQMIRAMNLKVTTQRMAILEYLHGGSRHTSAQELYEALNGDFPDIGFATVYRFLKMLSKHGFVNEVRMGGLPARYELTTQHHHDHLTCEKCGKICEFENGEIERLQEKVARHFGFKLTHHVLELYGVCSDCQLQDHPASDDDVQSLPRMN
jgi:Fur family ferric uptake transcriptional regulator